MCTILASFIVMLSSLGILRCQGEIIQDPLVEGSEGQKVNLPCKHPQISTETIFWYRQRPNEAPHSIVSGYKNNASSEILDGAMIIASDRKANEFSFNRVTLEDSGVYYCALRGGSGYKPVFGRGTRLVVTPNLKDSEPSVYKLQPAKEGDRNISACLITDYSPALITVGADGIVPKEVNGSVVVVKESGKETPSYGTVVWGTAKEADGCYAKQKEEIFKSESAEAATTCSEKTTGSFETDERLNLLSLTVLGLRVIFLKCVAFNLLFTFHAWSS